MTHVKRIFLFALLSLFLSAPSSAYPESSPLVIKKGGSGPMVIRSNTLEIDAKRQVVKFTGDVDVKRDDFTITCDRMRLYFKNLSENKDMAFENLQVDRIVARGRVKISRAEGGVAMAEEAVYHQNDEKVVLTGKPVVKQKNDFVEGTKITLFLKEKRSIVEGSKDKKIRAVLHPREKKGRSVDR
jgi:lipopolysaccharide export system protein LptA